MADNSLESMVNSLNRRTMLGLIGAGLLDALNPLSTNANDSKKPGNYLKGLEGVSIDKNFGYIEIPDGSGSRLYRSTSGRFMFFDIKEGQYVRNRKMDRLSRHVNTEIPPTFFHYRNSGDSIVLASFTHRSGSPVFLERDGLFLKGSKRFDPKFNYSFLNGEKKAIVYEKNNGLSDSIIYDTNLVTEVPIMFTYDTQKGYFTQDFRFNNFARQVIGKTGRVIETPEGKPNQIAFKMKKGGEVTLGYNSNHNLYVPQQQIAAATQKPIATFASLE